MGKILLKMAGEKWLAISEQESSLGQTLKGRASPGRPVDMQGARG